MVFPVDRAPADAPSRSLEVAGVSFAFGRQRLLTEVSFLVQQGDVLLIRGPNGSGKSTLLKIIAHLLHPSSGRIEYRAGDGVLRPHELRRHLGMCALEQNLYDELTALENLTFFGRLRLHCDCTGRAEELLGRAKLFEHRHKMARSLSSGMRQKLKLLVAVIHEPGFLLLDEPGSNLDLKGMAFLEEIILEQRQRGLVLIASNDPREFGYATRTHAIDF
jgi:heme exporter protein A